MIIIIIIIIIISRSVWTWPKIVVKVIYMTCIILVVAVTVFTILERLTASCFKSLFTFSFLKALEAYLLFLNKKTHENSLA